MVVRLNANEMSFFKECPLPADLCHIVMDFVHTADPRTYQKVIYEAQHYIWYCTELCGAWCQDMRPSEYHVLVKERDADEIRTRPLGYYQNLKFWKLFEGTHL